MATKTTSKQLYAHKLLKQWGCPSVRHENQLQFIFFF